MKKFGLLKLLIITGIVIIFFACNDYEGSVNVDPNWETVEDSGACSVNEDEFVAPEEGRVGLYYFYKMKDVNPNSISFGREIWERDATRDGNCFSSSDEYNSTFIPTNITSKTYTKFTTSGSRVLAAEFGVGENSLLEYINGSWHTPNGYDVISNDVFYPNIRFSPDGMLIITGSKGVYCQEGNNAFMYGYWTDTWDMAGGIGGSNSHIFVSAGSGFRGIYKWNASIKQFEETNQKDGCFYSIEALNDNEVFFGSYEKSNGTSGPGYTFGVLRFNGSSIEKTNLTEGDYTLAINNGNMYAVNSTKVYVWNNNTFVEIFDKGGKLKATGNVLYLLTGTEIYKFNGTTFSTFYTGQYDDIVAHDGRLYIFSLSGVKYTKDNETWINIPNAAGTVGISTSSGLFMGGGAGIQKMEYIK